MKRSRTCCTILLYFSVGLVCSRRLRSVDQQSDVEQRWPTNSVEFIWGTTTVAVGDTAVLHCSFDAIFQQLRSGNINWVKEVMSTKNAFKASNSVEKAPILETIDGSATAIASGKKILVDDNRLRVYRPHNSALSVLIIRRSKKKDAGVYRCNLSGSATRHKFMILNVTESKIEAQTSPATMRAKVGNDVSLWCNATGYPKPVVYWTREDRNRKLPDGSYQYWGNGLHVNSATESDTGIYACFLDNFVQPIVSYKFSLMVEDNPWNLEGYKMRYDSKQWYSQESSEPKPVKAKSFLLMCETRGASKPLPLIRWYRDGKALRNNRHFYIIEDTPESRDSYASSTLVIMNFMSRFQGNYTCVASNVFRMKKLTFYIHGFLDSEEDSETNSDTRKEDTQHEADKEELSEDEKNKNADKNKKARRRERNRKGRRKHKAESNKEETPQSNAESVKSQVALKERVRANETVEYDEEYDDEDYSEGSGASH